MSIEYTNFFEIFLLFSPTDYLLAEYMLFSESILPHFLDVLEKDVKLAL